jgi:hypothetical protein
MTRLVNSKKPIVCLIQELSILPPGYELIEKLVCLKCAKYFYVYAPKDTISAEGTCPNCDVPFVLTIVTP